MSWTTVLALAFGLAMDAFAVAAATGMTLQIITLRHSFRLAFHFGLFQFMMPIIGWYAGSFIGGWTSEIDHWIVFGLLLIIGGKMLWEGWTGEAAHLGKDPTRGRSLVILSVATSLDALAVGLSMKLLGGSVLGPCIVIGLVAASMTLLGLHLGRRMGKYVEQYASVIGGLILIGIGVKTLVDHML